MNSEEIPADDVRALLLLPALPHDGVVDIDTIMATGRRMRRARRSLVSAICGIAALTLVVTVSVTVTAALQRTGSAATPGSGPPTGPAAFAALPRTLACAKALPYEPTVSTAPSGTVPGMTSEEAIRIANTVGGRQNPPVATAYLAMVINPIANKVGLGDPTVARLTWVVDQVWVVPTPNPSSSEAGRAPIGGGVAINPPHPGDHVTEITLVDDATGKLGGNTSCAIILP